jgi:hypothetical protein
MPLGWRLMALVRRTDRDDWLATPADRAAARPYMTAAASPSRLYVGWQTSCDGFGVR